MIAAEIQSFQSTATTTISGHDHRQEQLRQVEREVGVERVDPARGEDRELARALLARAVQAEPGDALQQRRAKLRLGAGGGSAAASSAPHATVARARTTASSASSGPLRAAPGPARR